MCKFFKRRFEELLLFLFLECLLALFVLLWPYIAYITIMEWWHEPTRNIEHAFEFGDKLTDIILDFIVFYSA